MDDGGEGREQAGEQPGQPRLEVVERTGSTSTDLMEALRGIDGTLDEQAARAWPHLSALQARCQSAGRGRGERVWQTPPAGALTVSFVLRPLMAAAELGWLPLLAGIAVSDALTPLLPGGWQARTVWPNDVVLVPTAGLADRARPAWVDGWGWSRKVAGILTEGLLPAGCVPTAVPTDRRQAPAVVLGVGVNVAQSARQLPVPWATSLALVGAQVQVDHVRDAVREHLAAWLGRWEAGGTRAAVVERVRQACASLGQEVEVVTPAGLVRGMAVDVTPELVVRSPEGRFWSLAAGDVRLVRLASGGWG